MPSLSFITAAAVVLTCCAVATVAPFILSHLWGA